MIEQRRVAALPFILESTEVLHLQAKEKGLELVFDVYDPNKSKAITESFKEKMRISDLNDRSPSKCPSGCISSFLSTSDYINVDPYKMNQVIGNLISNAIKFTPVGQTVTIRARKVTVDLKYNRFGSNHSHSTNSGSESPMRSSLSTSRIIGSTMPRRNSSKSTECSPRPRVGDMTLNGNGSTVTNGNTVINNSQTTMYDIETGVCHSNGTPSQSSPPHPSPRHPSNIHLQAGDSNSSEHDSSGKIRKMSMFNNGNGYLVVEVRDSGVGMAPEDSKRLFKEIVQFNPSELQVR